MSDMIGPNENPRRVRFDDKTDSLILVMERLFRGDRRKWTKIIEYGEDSFASFTAKQLRDRFRTLQKRGMSE